VAADRDDPEAFLMLGDLALRARQITLAELAINHAAELTEKYSKNARRLADLKKRSLAGQTTISEIRGLSDKTVRLATAWIKLDAKNAQPHRKLARAYFEKKQYTEAFGELKKVAQLDKKSARPEISLAQMYEAAGHRDVAKETMQLAAKQGSKDLRTRLSVARWALAVGQVKMAQTNIDAARKIDPESFAALALAGRLARHQGDQQAARKLLQDAVVRSPSNFAATNQLALAMADSKDKKDRLRGLQYAAVNLRTHADAKTAAGREAAVTYAWLAFGMGRRAEAKKAIEMALRGGSISSESAYYVAKVISDSGNNVLAAKILKPVLAMKRPFPHRDDAQKLLDQLAVAPAKKTKHSGGNIDLLGTFERSLTRSVKPQRLYRFFGR
jgi:tetratricopeptide (TPR) repeat protein